MGIDDSDDTLTDRALLTPRDAAAWLAKARADQDSMPAEHTAHASVMGRLTHDQQRPHHATDAVMRMCMRARGRDSTTTTMHATVRPRGHGVALRPRHARLTSVVAWLRRARA